MNESRGVLFAKGGTAAGGSDTTGATPDLLVVCHGMFLFHFVNDKDGTYRLLIDAPVVPAMPGKKGTGGDPGHVYLANSRVSADGASDLGNNGETYTLTGPAPLPLSRMTPHFGRPTATWHNDSSLVLPSKYRRSKTKAAYTIVMPLPEDYWGWRSVSPLRSKSGSHLYSPYVAAADPAKQVLPWSIFATHVFRYSGVSSLTLQKDGKQVWPPADAAPTVLHLFSQEPDFDEAIRLAERGVSWDHLKHLNALVHPNPGLKAAPGKSLAVMEEPTAPWGLKREDLLCLGERGSLRGTRKLAGNLVGPFRHRIGGIIVGCSGVTVNVPGGRIID